MSHQLDKPPSLVRTPKPEMIHVTFATTDPFWVSHALDMVTHPVRTLFSIRPTSTIVPAGTNLGNGLQMIGFRIVHTTVTELEYSLYQQSSNKTKTTVVDYKIAVARNIHGDYLYSFCWGDSAGRHADSWPTWNHDYTFTTNAGFRKMLVQMRYARVADLIGTRRRKGAQPRNVEVSHIDTRHPRFHVVRSA